jgi:glucokinase
MAILALDIGGTNIKCGTVEKNSVSQVVEVPTHAYSGKNVVIAQIDAAVQKNYTKKIHQIGISMAGPADYKKGIFTHPANLPLHLFNIKKYLGEKYNCTVRCENDARCYALAEFIAGKGIGKSTLVGVTLGTGVGFGVIIDKKVYAGRMNAGEFSKTVVFDGRLERTAEENLSGKFIIKGIPGAATPKVLFLIAKNGNKEALDRWELFGKNLGIVLANVMAAYDPEVIILGGQVSNAWMLFEKPMKKEIATILQREIICPVVKSTLEYPQLIGAAALF